MSVAQTTAPTVKTSSRMWLDMSPTSLPQARRDHGPDDAAALFASLETASALGVWPRCHQAMPMTNSRPAPPAKLVRVCCSRP